MPVRPSKNQEECGRLINNLSPSEVTILLSAIVNDKPDDYRSLFQRAADLWNFPVKDKRDKRTTLPKDLYFLSKSLCQKASDRREGKPQSEPDWLVDVAISMVRSYTVADLKVVERDAIKRNLERVARYRNELKGSRSFPQQKAVDVLITRTKSLVIEQEDM